LPAPERPATSASQSRGIRRHRGGGGARPVTKTDRVMGGSLVVGDRAGTGRVGAGQDSMFVR
jgi:hypothetical protein